MDRFARETAIKWACESGNEKCLNDMFAQVHVIGHHDRSAPKGLEEVIYCNGLRGINKQNEWLWMWQKMKESKDKRERSVILKSLGCSEDEEILISYLESAYGSTSDVNYSWNETWEVFNAVATSRAGVKAFVALYRKHRELARG